MSQARRTGRRIAAGQDTGTREDILGAARRLFAEHGYDRTSMRAIARAAGVDAALVHYFFGTKQALYDTLVELPFDPGEVVRLALAPGVDGLGERVARFVVNRIRDPDTGPAMIALLRTAAAQPDAARLLRETYTRRLLEPLARALHTDRPMLRAALCSSQLLGLAMAERIIGVDAIADADTDLLVAIYGETLQRYLTGPLPSGGQPRRVAGGTPHGGEV